MNRNGTVITVGQPSRTSPTRPSSNFAATVSGRSLIPIVPNGERGLSQMRSTM